jgi:hypothetical protein
MTKELDEIVTRLNKWDEEIKAFEKESEEK